MPRSIGFFNPAIISAAHSISSGVFWERPMPTAELQGLRLYYEITGSATGPVIALVNSLGSDLHMWDKVLPYLTQDFRVLRYDARGHGLSSAPPVPYSIDELGADFLGLLETIPVENVFFCGLSLGGVVGLWLGIHAPQRITKLVLANTAARIGTTEG